MTIAIDIFSVWNLIQFLDLFGTMAFAVTGAIKAVEHRLDIFGVIVLAAITGLAGGIIRDVLLGRIPPSGISELSYVSIAIVTAVSVFYLYPKFKSQMGLFLTFDAVGLGVFTIIGATIALNTYGFNVLLMVFAGMITAIGGGIIRDALVNETPLVFRKELYASISFVGVLLYILLIYEGVNLEISSIICIIFVTFFRIMAIHYKWNLPIRGTGQFVK
ncbi:MAG TPA: trimeric intracellular cation channel family protein [Nitrososphaeraceae archaeon]|nr:trimeric intracellular cation channel family protein [Nitrososphaeraceae archaeon]